MYAWLSNVFPAGQTRCLAPDCWYPPGCFCRPLPPASRRPRRLPQTYTVPHGTSKLFPCGDSLQSCTNFPEHPSTLSGPCFLHCRDTQSCLLPNTGRVGPMAGAILSSAYALSLHSAQGWTSPLLISCLGFLAQMLWTSHTKIHHPEEPGEPPPLRKSPGGEVRL